MAKVSKVCNDYGLNESAFLSWLKSKGYSYDVSVLGSFTISDDLDISFITSEFLRDEREKQETAAQDRERVSEASEEKRRALASMLITSGFTFDGYTITKYSGYISGDDAVSIDRPSQGFWGSVDGHVGTDLLKSLAVIRRNALAELKESAYALGCNAVIGVDFDYITLDPETATSRGGTLYLPFLFAVTANGNAVTIERRPS